MEATGKGIVVKSNRQEVIVNSVPEVSIEASGGLSFCPGGSVTLDANVEAPSTYKWYKNETFFYGSLPQITLAESGTYKVEANSYGCKSFSGEVTLTRLPSDDPSCSTGIDEVLQSLSVFPNPFGETFSLDISRFKTYPVDILLYDLQGKIAYQAQLSKPGIIEIKPDISNGFYTLKLQSGEEIQWLKLIRQD